MRGNGFFIEVPGQTNDIILTAGHNLVDSHGMSSTDLMAWWQDGGEWISIATENVRVSKAYLARPTEQSATDDFGIIILKSENVKQRRQAFGFSIRLGEDDRIDGQCNISSYSAKSFLMDGPTQSTGRFVNPIIAENQLEYLVGTSAGMSGSVVWVGYNGSPIAVAIHNYGPRIKDPRYGSRGSRINLKMMRQIFEWTGVYRRAVNVVAAPSMAQSEPKKPLRLMYSRELKFMQVQVHDPKDRNPETTFEVLPVYSRARTAPTGYPRSDHGFACRQDENESQTNDMAWISWDVEAREAYPVTRLSLAQLARLNNLAGDSSTISLIVNIKEWIVVVRPDKVSDETDLEYNGSVFPGLDFASTIDQQLPTTYKKFKFITTY
ncbi:uncharacterized protein G6M90_00g000020 [Metarhizium brunneum]|uniref:Serine protease n=1 Tax=Metarhizium brunneum TaxID=500148 RepID=A0A7D5UTK9_9HYPO|nr:hypothetical protein G6M90_00g000020 [Metarhizium brunneum]